LQLRLAVRGGLRAETANGQAVRFVDEDAAAVVNYAGLKVWDADGRSLPARLDATPTGQVRIVVDDRGAKYPITVDPIAQQAYLKASNTNANDNFGYAVAASGDTVVVGADFEDSNGVGVNPPSQADNSAGDSGAAYVFVRTGGVWSQQAYLKASNTGTGDLFGVSVAVWGDRVVVGARREDSNMDSDTVQIEVAQGGACPADLVLADLLLPGTQTLEATATVTLGPNLIVNGTNIVVNAPTVTILSGTTISGTFSVGNTPSCP